MALTVPYSDLNTSQDSSSQNTTRADEGPSKLRNTFLVRVVLLDDEPVEIHLKKDALAGDLVHLICDRLHTRDVEYFSLLQCFDREESHAKWVKLDKKGKKQFRGKGTIHFRIKFYPLPFVACKSESTRRLICLQLQKDLNSGRLPASDLDLVTLSSLMAQIVLGSYDATIHLGNYIAYTSVAPPNSRATDLVNSIISRHRSTTSGMSSTESINRYLEYAQSMPMYGATLFPVRDAKQNSVDMFVSSSGIDCYQNNTRIHSFDWRNILELCRKTENFSLTVRSDSDSSEYDRIIFRGPGERFTKRMWQFCVDSHAFYRPRDLELNGPRGSRKLALRPYFGKPELQTSVKIKPRTPVVEDLYATVLPRDQRPEKPSPENISSGSVSDNSDDEDEEIYAVPFQTSVRSDVIEKQALINRDDASDREQRNTVHHQNGTKSRTVDMII